MPDQKQIETVLDYIKTAYKELKQYHIQDREGALKHIFTIVNNGERRVEIHVMRTFWDDYPTGEAICVALVRLGLIAKIFEGKGHVVSVWHDRISIGHPLTV